MTEHPDDIAETARTVAAAALAIDGVHSLYGGQFGEIATYVPGECISGVLIGPEHGELHIVGDLERNLRDVAEDARVAAERLAGLPFVVTVADVYVGSAGMEER
ncbi:hypothetical protein [Aldersonia kunmingensis]|uniref:hypothetical protein n=1 Tax=Aldersonia kunmingensis TaxID=408066 RepID=UPI00082C9F40|nr:hypothetical protein [Aldersonia kunmingensis]